MRNLPTGWSLTNLAELAKPIGGGTPAKSNSAYWKNGTIPWISPKDMKRTLITSCEDRVTEQALSSLKLIPSDSILIVVRSGILSHTLPVATNSIPVTINQDMRAFTPYNGVSASFIKWQIIARQNNILSLCSKNGTTVSSIEGPALSKFPILIAPANEQLKIVAKLEELLSELDAGVAELKAAQKKLHLYRQSLLKAAVEGSLTAEWRTRNTPQETGAELLAHILKERRARWEKKQLAKFKEQGKTPPKGWQNKYPEPVTPDTSGLPELPEGWVWASVEQLSHFVRNGVSKTSNTKQVGIPILRINAVRAMNVNTQEIKHIDISESEVTDYFIDPGDLLATRYNGSIDLLGVIGLVRTISEKALHPDKLIRIKPVLDTVLGQWMEISANTGASRGFIVSKVKTTAGQTGISGADLKKMPIPLPPISEQQIAITTIDDILISLTDQSSSVEFTIKKSAAQRHNILRAAFSGKLVPQDPNDEPASVLLERIRAERAEHSKAAKRPRGRKPKATI